MKKIKIFCLPSHQSKERTSGVDFARIIQPMKHLNGYKDDEVELETTIYDINKATDWQKVAEEYDVIYFNYLNNPWGFAAMGAMARKHNTKLVMDLDDSLWDVRSDNPAHSVYHKGSEALINFTAICNEVDYMTVTNSYLKNVTISNTYKRAEKIKVFPNYIDLERYLHRSKFKDDGKITLLHFGSTTHFEDLQNIEFITGVNKIMKEYPTVSIKFIGAFIPKFKKLWGRRYEVGYGDSDIYKWINNHFGKVMDETDILVVPLEDNKYTRCKSSIKWIEASSAKIPGVWQAIRQYQEVVNGTNGLLAKSSEDWYTQIKKLIDNPEKRKSMGEKAFEDVKKDWTIQQHVKDYAEFFKKIVE